MKTSSKSNIHLDLAKKVFCFENMKEKTRIEAANYGFRGYAETSETSSDSIAMTSEIIIAEQESSPTKFDHIVSPLKVGHSAV